MSSIVLHPMQVGAHSVAVNAKLKALRFKTTNEQAMAGFFDDLFDTAWDAISGLGEAVGEALAGVVRTVKEIGETIALIVRAAVGDVSWDRVFDSLGEVFQEVGNVLVVINPLRITYNFLREAPLTRHAFNELDKFTGGLLTNVVNVSDVVFRAMRGDPISKVEIIKNILTIIQVATVIVAGPVGIGIWAGSLVGREVCKNQTKAQDLCRGAFTILGAAAGGWYQAAEDVAFSEVLSQASEDYLRRRGIDEVSIQAIEVCKQTNFVGDRECEIIGRVAANYIKNEMSDDPMEWPEFLATELARIGVEELMLQWFPEDSKEAQAIRWQIQYRDTIVPYEVSGPAVLGPGVALLLAGGATMLLLGAGT